MEGVKEFINFCPKSRLSTQDFDIVFNMLQGAIPPEYLNLGHPLQPHRLLPAAVMLSNATSHYPKETRASVAFSTVSCLM